MQRYPTDTSTGLALPITSIGYEMVAFETARGQGHHYYFERSWYNTPLRNVFRNLVGHVVRMNPRDHTELHDRFSAPLMLRDNEMVEYLDETIALNGMLEVHKERKLRETYQIELPQWEQIRSGHGETLYASGNRATA